jgi:hypothetical protein
MKLNHTTLWALISLFSALAASLAMLLPLSIPWRPLITFWFLLFCPGMAVIPFFHFKDRLTELVLALAFSIVLDTSVALLMVMAKIWSPFWGLTLIISLSALAAFAQIWIWRYGSARTAVLENEGQQ